MPYYLAPYEKVPVRDAVQFHPVGCEGVVRGPIDLRPDGGATLEGAGLNACLLWLPRPASDWRLELLAESPTERLAAPTRRYLSRLFWVPEIHGDTFGDTVLRLMIDPPRDGWRPIRPTWQGVYEIWLGGRRLAGLRTIRGGTTITEDFDKADNGLGPDLTWTTFHSLSGGTLGVTSNQANHKSGGEAEARADSDLATDDHYVQATAGADYSNGSNFYIGVLCRKDSSATRTQYRWMNFGTDGPWELAKFVGGAETVLDNAYTTDPVATESFKLEANGSTIRGFHTAAQQRASVTDAAITNNLRCGIALFGNLAYIDNFEAGDLAVGDPGRTARIAYYYYMRRR